MLGYIPTIGEIQSVSYYTKTSHAEASGDWFLQIYTVKQASGNYGSWYHDIINAEPYLANKLERPCEHMEPVANGHWDKSVDIRNQRQPKRGLR